MRGPIHFARNLSAIFVLLYSMMANADTYREKIEKCTKAADDYEATRGRGEETGILKQDCLEACQQTPGNVRPNNTWEAGKFNAQRNRCLDQKYNCGNVALCRTAVADIQIRCKTNPRPAHCDENMATTCVQACAIPQNNNCTEYDKNQFGQLGELCSVPSARPLITDAQATQILRQRELDMIRNGGIPTQESSFRSLAFGDIPRTPTPPRTVATERNDNPSTNQDAVNGNVTPVTEQNSGQAQAATTSQGGAGGDAGGAGGAMGSFGGGGGGSGGSFASAPSGSGSEVTGGRSQSDGGGSSSGIGAGAPALGSDSLSSSDGVTGGGGRGGAASARRASVPAAGGLLPGASFAGGGAVGGAGASPAAGSAAAGTGGPRAPGSSNSANFNSQFHRGGGAQSPQAIAALKKQNQKVKRKRGRRGAGDSLDTFMSSLWGKKTFKAKRMPAHAAYHNPEIGRGIHDVFRPVTNYFNSQPLEEDGSLAE
ncbi:MAG: hypothetical protein K2Q26_07805 [Bdellovibrionales bacterium]|nr:hypothetical protein [Bdellovibrionales bacterium]